MPARLYADVEGVTETVKAFGRIEQDLRPEANSELRRASRQAAETLAGRIRAAASSSPTPVARRVAATVKTKSDRYPTVTIGGRTRVGARGAPAAALVWGSEHGGRNFAAGPSAGYWIAPAVRAYASSGAPDVFRRALYDLTRRYGLA